MSNELAVVQSDPLVIFQQLATSGASIEQLNAFLALQERVETARLAREKTDDERAFNLAMVEFHKDPPRIYKDNHVSYTRKDGGVVKYNHATLGNVTELITAKLAQFGIIHEWIPSQEGNKITITCRLKLGMYSKDTTLSSLPDDSGSKNSIQAIASATSYMERYTLLKATGMATSEDDDDGRGSELDKAILERVDLIEKASTIDELKGLFTEGYTVAQTAKDESGMDALLKAKDSRHKTLVELEQQQWRDAFKECATVDEFNQAIVPLMKERGKAFKDAAAAHAKSRGFKANKATGLYEVAQ